MKISPVQTPGFNRLYLDYLENFDKLESFYSVDYRASAALLAQTDKLVKRTYAREKLCAIFQRQNERYHAGKKTAQAIELFSKPETVAVVTGQQTGLFGGPLLTMYKALTAAKLAERLQARRGKPVVTIFWMATDDDDLVEADQCGLLDRSNEFHNLTSGFGQWPRRPFSQVVLDESIDVCRAKLNELLPDSEFKPALLERLGRCFRPGASLADAFGAFLQSLTSEFGLILLDPADPEVKCLAAPIIAREISGHSPSTVAALKAIAQLEKLDYSPQVPLRDGRLNLFYIKENQRHALEFSGDKFSSTDGALNFTQNDLLAAVEKTPERFAPNVILRPIIQDYLLPTVAYIGGPAEVAYFAEYRGVYETFAVHMPAIYPRKSLTLVEQRGAQWMQKYGLSITDLWKPIEPKINELAKKEAPEGLFEPISTARDELTRELQTLRERVAKIDPTLDGFIESSAGKILHQLDGIDKKITQAVKRRNETLTSQIHKAATAVFPNGHLQERSLSLLPYLAKYGGGIVRQIYEAIDLGDYEHQVVQL